MDLCLPLYQTALPAGDDFVDVFRAKLSRSSLLRRVGWYQDQHLDPGVLAHGAGHNVGSGPVPLMRGVDSP
jgi:hypothetical protein